MTKKVRPCNTILNIAGGKIQPLDLPDYPYFLVNLDTMYFNCTSVMDLEIQHENFKRNGPANIETKRNYVNFDVYEFLERYRLKFDSISIYRFMEHVPLDKLLYFIYLLSTSVVLDGTIDVIVPNIEILSHKILKERDLSIDEFPAHDILVTTEVVNEPSSPHLSLWSPLRAKYYFELEKRFVVENIVTPFEFDGREIYMRFSARRVK
jgi:hypothetical protein